MTRRRNTHRMPTVVLATAALLLLGAPAWADPAGPTNYDSSLLGVTPATDVVDVAVTGGDAFLAIEVEPGHSATVLGYGRGAQDEEPYLRIDEDGTVFANLNSPAYYLNDDRFAQTEVPATATVDAEPRWVEVATGGSYEWHDHRIHWMSPGLPRAVERQPGDRVLVQPWTVPIEVDGEPVALTGELYWLAPRSPVAPALGAIAGIGLVLLLWRRSPASAGPVGVVLGGVVALVVAVGAATVAGSEALPTAIALLPVVIGLGLGSRAIRLDGRDREQTVLLASIALLAWALPRVADTLKPVIPGVLPDLVPVLGIALVTGAALTAAVLAGMRLRPAPATSADGATA